MNLIMYIMNRLLKVLPLFLFIACYSLDKEVKEVMDSVESRQQMALGAFLGYYENEGEHLELAKFLVANIMSKHSIEGKSYQEYQAFLDSASAKEQTINNRKNFDYRTSLSHLLNKRECVKIYDLEILDVDSLIQNTDTALDIWMQTPWAGQYSNEIFKQYIVPYRIADEPLEYGWRTDAYEKYKHLLQAYKDSSLVALCRHVYQHLDYRTNNLFWGEPLQSYSANVKYKQGTCSDYAVFLAMVMRSLGIPTSLDFVPYWGDRNNGHTFNSLLLPDGTCRGYDNEEDIVHGLTLPGKVPKIYRKMYEVQRSSLLYKLRDAEYIPEVFAQHDLIDVTEHYSLPLSDVTIVPRLDENQTKIAYLSVFSPGEWRPIAWAEYRKGKQVSFKRIGVGYTLDEEVCDKGENLGKGCLFLPVCYVDGEMLPIHYPFILTQEELPRYLIPNEEKRERVVLHRKFPRRKRVIDFARKMQGGYFELSNDPDFNKSVLVYFIDSVPASHLQIIPILEKEKYRYMRYYKRDGGISIGEIGCLDSQDKIVQGKLLADHVLMDDSDLKNINDGNILSFFDIGELKNTWVGLDFGKPQKFSALFFSPRTDDNDISLGDEYELFYWNQDWVSLGKQIATGYSLAYEEVPKNSLLWLRNLTKGVEERPFTYENGMQIWW